MCRKVRKRTNYYIYTHRFAVSCIKIALVFVFLSSPYTVTFLHLVCSVLALDLYFVLDESGSVGSENFDNVKGFVSSIVRNFIIGPDHVQVGVLTYASSPTIDFYLNTYSNVNDITQAVANITYSRGGTYTADALDEVRVNGFTAANGARPVSKAIPRVIILITDGRSENTADTIIAAEAVHDDGIIVFAVGVAEANEEELNAVASRPDFKFFLTDFDVDKLRNLQVVISERACEGWFL